MNAVASVGAHHRDAPRIGVLLDDVAKLAVGRPRFHCPPERGSPTTHEERAVPGRGMA